MPVIDLYHLARETLAEIVPQADREHIRIFGEVDEEFAYSWFESLAKAVNRRMVKGEPPLKNSYIFRLMSVQYSQGDDEVRKCIDTAFTENLFWEVPAEKVAPYWQVLPTNLKELYIGFHHRTPL